MPKIKRNIGIRKSFIFCFKNISIGSVTWVMTSTNKKKRTPMAIAFKKDKCFFDTVQGVQEAFLKKLLIQRLFQEVEFQEMILDLIFMNE